MIQGGVLSVIRHILILCLALQMVLAPFQCCCAMRKVAAALSERVVSSPESDTCCQDSSSLTSFSCCHESGKSGPKPTRGPCQCSKLKCIAAVSERVELSLDQNQSRFFEMAFDWSAGIDSTPAFSAVNSCNSFELTLPRPSGRMLCVSLCTWLC